jgi:hypothetical protein
MTVRVRERCQFCLREIEPEYAYRRVTGWERKRDGGGTNALRLRHPHDAWACSQCINTLAAGRPLPTYETEVT